MTKLYALSARGHLVEVGVLIRFNAAAMPAAANGEF